MSPASQGTQAVPSDGPRQSVQWADPRERRAMPIINGHFDGQRVVLDEPVRAGILADTPVKVVFESATAGHVLARIAALAVSTLDLPPVYSEQHQHYVK